MWWRRRTRREILESYDKRADKVQREYERGLITDEERRQELIEIWTHATAAVAQDMEAAFPADQLGLDDGQLRRPR